LAIVILISLLVNGNARSHLHFRPFVKRLFSIPEDSSSPKKEEFGSFVQKEESKKDFLNTPKNIVRGVTYDIKTGKYLVTEKENGVNIKPPMYLTFEEYMVLTEKEEYKNIVQAKIASSAKTAGGAKNQDGSSKSPVGIGFNLPANGMIFGEGGIDVKLQGSLDFQMGYQHNTIRNPALTAFQQTQGLIDMDMGMNINLAGKIGDKFQNSLRFNNQAGFGFEGQQIRLAYNGKEDEIIRNLEAGNVSFDVPTQLMQGVQGLWGVKTELQFAKLNIKTVISQQRSNRQSKTIENGAEVQTFEITADQYDQNRHFFLAQSFRDNYEKALKDFPVINSPYQIQNVEVWVSNRSIQTQSVRDVVAFQDLGEKKPYSPQIIGSPGSITPSNESNNLYGRIKLDQNIRNGNTAMQNLQAYPLKPYEDFEKAFLRKLNPSEYTINNQLGYISLNSTLQSNDVLAVSYQYTFQGQVFQVGDLTRDITLPDSTSNEPSRLLFLKLLKGTNVNPTFPTWHLMMKNVYNLNAYQVSPTNFRLDVFYNDPGLGVKRYLPKGNLQDQPLTRTMGLDRLNVNNEPFPDGLFDFVPNLTIQATNGKIYFPVLEPFGSHLKRELTAVGDQRLIPEYVFQQIYDSTQFIAQNYPELNRYIIKGSFQSSNNKRISLGLNTPPGSVFLTMNGQRLMEGTDYTVEYGSLGYVEIADHIMASGGKITVEYENNSTFGLQQKNFVGTRLEYRFNERFKIGATYQKLGERPFNNKITYGEDPIKNQMIGGDINYASNLPFLTKLLDKLPFYKTNEMSSITAYGEYAKLIPGHFPTIGEEGTIYLDDFESASISYNFGQPANLWRIASTPVDARDESGNVLFPEATRINDLTNGYNRAKLSWYNIANNFYSPGFSQTSRIYGNTKIQRDLYNRLYRLRDIYPARNTSGITDLLNTLDLSFYPNQRGPYNYEFSSGPTPGVSIGINADGTLKKPTSRWAGIQRSIENTNFETNNIEFIQFWMLDPFIKDRTRSKKGDFYINLGYVSEDVLKDSRMSFEHGLVDKKGPDANLLSHSRWAWVPKTQPINNAFSNENSLRPLQDIGLDGSNDLEERDSFRNFLTAIRSTLTPSAYNIIENDPSSDNFKHFFDPSYSSSTADIVGLYKDFTGQQNNSPVINVSSIPLSSYNLPDNEDINRDNTLNENEAYFQYKLPLFYGMNTSNNPYVISRTVSANAVDLDGDTAVWLQVRIPIKEFKHKVGSIGDFRNIQFVRMFLTNFEDSAVIRLADLAFIRNQWRKYPGNISNPTDLLPKDNGEQSFFDVGAVSLEENSKKTPVNYLTPPGIIREVGLNATSNPIALNEAAMRLSFCNLKDGDARACFKPMNFDFRQFKTMKLFFHAENNPATINPMLSGDVSAFIRLGTDFRDNYYEYEIPLKVTDPTFTTNAGVVWPDSNQMTITLEDLVSAKYNRNIAKFPSNTPYVFRKNGRNISIVGNPDLGAVKIAMIGIRNRATNDKFNFKTDDDGNPKCGEVWVNELRLEGLNEEGGSAALANINIKLADLGTANISASMHTIGFGQIHQRVNERARDDFFQYNFNTNLQLGKLLPTFLGLQLPFYLQKGRSQSTPQFDPFSNDIKSAKQSEAIRLANGADSALEYLNTVRTIDERFGFNFTNVRILPVKPSSKAFILAPRFFNASYSFNSVRRSSPFIADDWIRTYTGELNYAYSAQQKPIEPFKKLIKSKSKGWDWLKAAHINFVPNSLSFSNRMDRTYGLFQQRTLPGEDFTMPTQFVKSWTWNRNYNFDYNPFRSLNLNFTAQNQARIDEPQGEVDNRIAEDSIMKSLKSFGRTTSYNHTASAKYSLPFNKFPLLNFITMPLSYNTSFNWNTGPQIVRDGQLIQSPQGNVISNTQSIGTNVNLKMGRLYAMIPVLKKLDIDNPRNSANASLTKELRQQRKTQQEVEKNQKETQLDNNKKALDLLKEQRKAIRKNDTLDRKVKRQQLKEMKKQIKAQRSKVKESRKQYNELKTAPDVLRIVSQPLLAVREVDVSYNIENSTTVSGFTGKPRFVGVDFNETNHLDPMFIAGMQPGQPMFAPADKYARWRWLESMGRNGLMTKDSSFNLPFMQSNGKNFKARMVVEPIKNVRVNLNWESDYTQKYTEFFVFNHVTGQFEHRNPLESGSYTYSDINLFSSFNKIQNSGKSENVTQLEKNSELYSVIFRNANPNGNSNPYIDPITGIAVPGYTQGYGPLQQDVLINSFLTTYRGGKVSGGEKNLSPFSRIPLPNWNINYNGLTQLNPFKKIFTSFSIRHGYSSRTTISNFNSEFRYEGGGQITNPIKIDSLNNNFIPYYYIPQLSMTESFNPLLGIDFTLKNSLNLRFEYKSSRTVSMSMIDYQLTESLNSGFTIGFGFQAKKITLPFTDAAGKQIVLDKGARFSCDINYTDNFIVNHKVGQGISTPVGGAQRLMINPKIDAQINDKVNISLFYNYVYNAPRLSNAFTTINGLGGLKMSFNLSQ
jgi:cell surface protein SprA